MAKGRRVGEGPLSNQRKEVRKGGGGRGERWEGGGGRGPAGLRGGGWRACVGQRGERKGLLRDAGRRGGREVRLPVELQLTASREESF